MFAIAVYAGRPPTLSEYIRFAERHGCTAEFGEKYGTPFVIMTSREGKSLQDFGVEPEDILIPTQIWHYDRRLGLESGWYKMNPEGEDL